MRTLIRLGLLAGFVAIARRILAPDEAPPPLIEPPRDTQASRQNRGSRIRA
jgi:hypothetical protein